MGHPLGKSLNRITLHPALELAHLDPQHQMIDVWHRTVASYHGGLLQAGGTNE